MGLHIARCHCGTMNGQDEKPGNGTDSGIYHERQQKELCAMHALNNLFQVQGAFTKKDLDELCNKLSPDAFFNPHRSILGLGNYDVNVIMAALQKKGYDTIWFDKRKSIDCLQFENIMGFILNIPTEYKWGFVRLPIHRKHWISIKCINNQYVNLDSKLDCPEIIGDSAALKEFLHNQLMDNDKELLLVVAQEVGETGAWRKECCVFPPVATADAICDSNAEMTCVSNGSMKQKSQETFPGSN
ncbi:josephin-2-like isoform X2 [Gigantopelta aegis]|uniref:josephin-2-like isoform X2 n=1 Tax=Gigantopelta aegis TaxID=1735272 RepID=UPI001B88CE05|nr:josephin-2-like isoform X2 [Gigantopelta aegis]